MSEDANNPFGDGILLEDMEATFGEQPSTAPKGTDLSSIRLEGDNVPEEFRGKTLESMVEVMRAMSKQNSTPAPAPVSAPSAPAPVAPLPTYNREAIQAMVDSGDVIGAIEAAVGYGHMRAQHEFDQRIAPLFASGSSILETNAKAKYKDEFELFGPEINQLAQAAGTALTLPGAWDNLIAFVRGKDGNLDKLIEHKTTRRVKVADDDIAPVIRSQRGNSGSPFAVPGRKPSLEELRGDEHVRRVCEASGMTIEDYHRYYV